MSIEIYDKAAIVKKADKFYYMLKYGSKNCFTCPFQTVVDNNFRNKYIKHQSRDSNWHVVAVGSIKEVMDDAIGNTYWNAPTSSIYGRIQFGNRFNIALWYAKNKQKPLDYELLDDVQQRNVDAEIAESIMPDNQKYTIDLANIPENKKMEAVEKYCEKQFEIAQSEVWHNGKRYWKLDNL